MKLVGMTNGGSVILDLNQSEARNLIELARGLGGLEALVKSAIGVEIREEQKEERTEDGRQTTAPALSLIHI